PPFRLPRRHRDAQPVRKQRRPSQIDVQPPDGFSRVRRFGTFQLSNLRTFERRESKLDRAAAFGDDRLAGGEAGGAENGAGEDGGVEGEGVVAEVGEAVSGGEGRERRG